MTKQEFKKRWESNDDGGGINLDDVADCAKKWGVESTPKTKPINIVLYKVLKAANVKNAEDYNPDANEENKNEK